MYKKIQQLMDERKLTAYAVSKATGIDESSFSVWKKGEVNPSLKSLIALSNFFDVPLNYFLDGREAEKGKINKS